MKKENNLVKPSKQVEQESGYVVLWRDSEKEKTDKCPFCGERHIHGKGDGHRIAHCRSHKIKNNGILEMNSKIFNVKDGYIVKTRNKI